MSGTHFNYSNPALIDGAIARASDVNNLNAATDTAFRSVEAKAVHYAQGLTDNLDAKSKRILNLPVPLSAGEPLRLAELTALEAQFGAAESNANAAQDSATAANASAISAANSALSAENSQVAAANSQAAAAASAAAAAATSLATVLSGFVSGPAQEVTPTDSLLAAVQKLNALAASGLRLGIGDVLVSARLAAPTGFLLCDGSNYLKASYPDLSALVGHQNLLWSVATISPIPAPESGGFAGGGSHWYTYSTGGTARYASSPDGPWNTGSGAPTSSAAKLCAARAEKAVIGLEVTGPKYAITTNGGANWSSSTVAYCYAACITDGGVIVVGGRNSGLTDPYIATGASAPLTTRTSSFDASQSVYGLAAIGATVMAISHTGKVSLSTDAGTTWANKPDAPAVPRMRCLRSVGGSFVFAAASGGLYRSTDNGATWALVISSVALSTDNFDFIERFGDFLVARAAGDKTVATIDGMRWTLVKADLAGIGPGGMDSSGRIVLLKNQSEAALYRYTPSYDHATRFSVPALSDTVRNYIRATA
ncbi:phage tail protein [Chitinilyticum litopenaei]|uniref:phage tail protein n=1 Tax=Chitinilyticum litopenaei TaxID=1121276 RepID=UPI00048EC5F1|nr:phage tail protein [Chitinilyticum litopenaei]